MGVLNVTPDSFSGDGIYMRPEEAAERAAAMVEAGAEVLDLGGESTRPGYSPVDLDEEIVRVIPALRAIVRRVEVPISVDTTRAAVAEQALAEGASIINDVSGLSDPRMLHVVAEARASLVIVHHGGRQHGSLVPSVVAQLRHLVVEAEASGVDPRAIAVDPGLGIGKGWRENFEIMRDLEALAVLGKSILVGPSRKGMIGRVLGVDVHDRLEGSIALLSLCVAKGADIVRVHDVQEMVRAARVMDALVRSARL